MLQANHLTEASLRRSAGVRFLAYVEVPSGIGFQPVIVNSWHNHRLEAYATFKPAQEH